MSNLNDLPVDLPKPISNGECDHLEQHSLPDIELPSTQGGRINLKTLPGKTVLYIYPMTGRPDIPLPENWDEIPGARGCTPQSCAFRDHHQELQQLGTAVFGLSTQSTDDQREAANRLHLPFTLLSDQQLKFATALNLPIMQVEGKTLIKRTTLICQNGAIEKTFYPVFPPDKNAENVIAYLSSTNSDN